MGCGLGLLGLNCLKLFSPKKFIFTDCHDKVLEQLQINITLNRDYNNQDLNRSIVVDKLDWNDLENSVFLNEHDLDIDVILASGKFILNKNF